MIGLANGLKIGAAALVGAVVAYGSGYLLGTRDGKRAAAVAAIENTVKALEARGKTDEKISTSDAGELCRHYGLQSSDVIECVRRLEETNTITRNSGVDHQPR